MNYIVRKIKASMVLFLFAFVMPQYSFAMEHELSAGKNSICVENASDKLAVFAVQIGDEERAVKELAVGEKLCVKSIGSNYNGVVSVYEEIDAMEGCSRIVALGTLEKMFKFSEADRCLWSSNS
ncbi:MAG: hypothetical protein L3J15_09025 [Devosiaceae bacterium]|nr:hypothetical protein [Devosiaceae bacterium]